MIYCPTSIKTQTRVARERQTFLLVHRRWRTFREEERLRHQYGIGFTYASSEVHFRSTESQTFYQSGAHHRLLYQSIMTADDSIKCRCANSGMTGQVGGFQNPGDCLQAFPSFLPHPLPALLLAPFFERSLIQNPRLPLPLSSLRERGKREKRKI